MYLCTREYLKADYHHHIIPGTYQSGVTGSGIGIRFLLSKEAGEAIREGKSQLTSISFRKGHQVEESNVITLDSGSPLSAQHPVATHIKVWKTCLAQ